MIITYPVRIPYTLGSQQRVVPDAIYNNSEILSGSFPMGKNRFWHGGLHLHPTDRETPIRAIADGVVVAYRYDLADATDAFFDKVPYSRSFVLLKHETELGQTSLGVSKLTFYSLYMHLRAWGEVKNKADELAVNFLRKNVPEYPEMDKNGHPVLEKYKHPVVVKAHDELETPTADGACHSGTGHLRVRRGDILGYCGNIPDNLATPSRGIHFEILFDDVAFLDNANKAVWGRCVLIEALSVREELLAPEMITVDPTKPLSVDSHQDADGYTKIKVGHDSYWVTDEQISKKEAEVPDPHHTRKMIKKMQTFANGKTLQGVRKDPRKNEKTLAKGTSIVPWFGSWLNPGEFREEIIDGKTWIQVYIPDTNKLCWAEKKAVHYTSDADWPYFHKLEEHGTFSTDGFIDDEGMAKLLAAYEVDRAEKNLTALTDDEDKLRHLISKHPTEWSKQDIAKRFDRVTKDDFGAAKLLPEQFAKLTKHIERLSFWEQVPGMPNANGVWHAHPIKFIEQLAKCMWLSQSEIQGLMASVSKDTLATHSINLNKTMMQWGFSNRLEQTHYLAQGAHESGQMRLMTELPSKYASSASNYKGRGFVQITSESNYGMLNTYLVKHVRDVDLLKSPELLGSDSYLAFAASCWYWRSCDVRRSAIKGSTDDVVDEVGRVINRGPGRRDNQNYPPVNRDDRLNNFHHMKVITLE
jgi:predicted chitinase